MKFFRPFVGHLFSIVVVAALTACASLQEPPNPETKQGAASQQQREPDPVLAPSGASTQDTASRAPEENGQQQQFQMQLGSVADWAMFIVTFVGLCLAFCNLKALQRQISVATTARLHIDGLTVANFSSGEQPVFFLRIANTGTAPAENVEVFMQADYKGGHTKQAKPNTILVPANSVREYYFRAGFPLPDNLSELSQWGLTVSGTVTHAKTKIDFCFKYNHWDGERPKGVPIFVPCDFDTRRHIAATGLAGSISLAGAVATLKITRAEAEGRKRAEDEQR